MPSRLGSTLVSTRSEFNSVTPLQNPQAEQTADARCDSRGRPLSKDAQQRVAGEATKPKTPSHGLESRQSESKTAQYVRA